MLSKLTSVTSLTSNRWQNLGAQPLQDFLPHLTALSEIALENVTLNSAGQLFSMLNLCPSLTTLAVVWVSWGPSSSPIVYSHGRYIRKLRLASCPIREFLDVFASQNVSSDLACHTVEIRGIVPEDIGRFLEILAGNLRHLTIGFKQDGEARGIDAEGTGSVRSTCCFLR